MGEQAEGIKKWSELSDNSWDTLLLANGFSLSISSKFAYENLLENADHDARLKAITKACVSCDFEVGLDSIDHALKVLKALVGASGSVNTDAQDILDRLDIEGLKTSLRESLIRAVHESHPEHAEIPYWVYEHTAEVMMKFRDVFTANYDLIPYWSLMTQPYRFADFFIGTSQFTFDEERANRFKAKYKSKAGIEKDGKTCLHYIHGALHLRQRLDGKTEKLRTTKKKVPPGKSFLTQRPDPKLLSVITEKWEKEPEAKPLFVSEGSSEGKIQKIHSSEYLSWCLRELERGQRNTVVFGSGFHAQDDHIWHALKSGSERVAVSIYRSDVSVEPDEGELCAKIRAKLYGCIVDFFWSDTHPLGDPSRSIGPDCPESRPTDLPN